MSRKPPTTPPKSFEEAVAELEKILADIEAGELGLEDTLARYERGNFLIRHCRQVLTAAEQQIEIISKGPAGEAEIKPLETPSLPMAADTPAAE